MKRTDNRRPSWSECGSKACSVAGCTRKRMREYRYCQNCKRRIERQMRRDGYFQDVPRVDWSDEWQH